jgi:hypothetical protein
VSGLTQTIAIAFGGLLIFLVMVAGTVEAELIPATCTIWYDGLDEGDTVQINDTFTATAHQEEMARLVLGATRAQGHPRHAAEIALSLALTRSGLRNLSGTDDQGEGIYSLGAVVQSGFDRLDPAEATIALATQITATENWEEQPATAFAPLVGADPDLVEPWEETASDLVDRWWSSQANPSECLVQTGENVVVTGTGDIVSVNGIQVHHSIAGRLQALLTAASADGYNLGGWGWRDSSAQIRLRREHCGTSNYAVYEMPSSQCNPPTARPGRSMHEQGLAIDFTINGASITSRSSGAFLWLQAHAADYGFYNFPSEPWHWSTNGR